MKLLLIILGKTSLAGGMLGGLFFTRSVTVEAPLRVEGEFAPVPPAVEELVIPARPQVVPEKVEIPPKAEVEEKPAPDDAPDREVRP
ncbi:MAG: hypothetical protein GWO24_08400 [Akkermansiaceae bacterium]|nr:hypothetical protein [Akkermansiaceae bacterium]